MSSPPIPLAVPTSDLPTEASSLTNLSEAQLNLFTGEAEPVRVDVREPEEGVEVRVDDGIAMVKGESGETVLLTGFGLYLGKKSERLTVRPRGGSVIWQFPFFRLQEVVIASRGISISSDVIEAMCERGIRICFLKGGHGSGEPFAMLQSPSLGATIRTRREQIVALGDGRGVELSRSIIEGKIRNQRSVLLYFAKYLKEKNRERYESVRKVAESLKALARKAAVIEGSCIDDCRGSLSGVEGTAGRLYWEAVAELVRDRATFLGRERRGATDEINSMLNYGYGILYAQVWGAIVNAGLDPFAGYMHVDRPGKPSLVLDLVEEFRQPVVDRVVIAHVNLGEPVRMNGGMLENETRMAIADKILMRLDGREQFEGKSYQVRSIIQMQARHVASYLRGDRDRYQAFRFKW